MILSCSVPSCIITTTTKSSHSPASPGLLVLISPGFGLIGQLLRTESLSLLLVDELHQNALVLEHVTLEEEGEEEEVEARYGRTMGRRKMGEEEEEDGEKSIGRSKRVKGIGG